jgi:flagellar biosynthesis protein FliQ
MVNSTQLPKAPGIGCLRARAAGFAYPFLTTHLPELTAANHKLRWRSGMDGLEVLDFGRDALWTTVWMCAPAMIAGLVVGLVIAFFQALTQIQEMTLVFVPKIIAIFAALLIFLPLMGGLLANFSDQIFTRIAEF